MSRGTPKCNLCTDHATKHVWYPLSDGKYQFLWLCQCHYDGMTAQEGAVLDE